MTKRQMIVEQIVSINRSASAEFLDQFNQSDLETYLQHLQDLRQPKLMGNCRRYEKYFTKAVTPVAQSLLHRKIGPRLLEGCVGDGIVHALIVLIY